jgi:putative toxin-antitoxin system antitoxin component (TIGR02293 family)
MTVAAIAEVLGGQKALKRRVRSQDDLMGITRTGLPSSVITTLAEKLSMDRSELAKAVGIPKRTLLRRLSLRQPLSANESDRTVRLARLLAHAENTFGTMAQASRWLQVPNLALGGKKPFELLDTDAGVLEVDTILGRIDYGIFS